MKKWRLVLCCVLVSAILLSGYLAGSMAGSENGGASTEEHENDAEQTALIERLIACINAGDWQGWAECYAAEFREDRIALINDKDSYRNNVGVLTVSSAEINKIIRVDQEYILRSCPELEPYAVNGQLECYSLELEIKVKQANDYFEDGICYQLAGLINVDGEWYVGAMISCNELPPELETDKSHALNSTNLRVEAIKESLYTNSVLYFPAESSLGTEQFTVNFDMPIRKNFLANNLNSTNMNIPYLLEWRENAERDHSVYCINDGNGEVVGAIGYTVCNSIIAGEKLLEDYRSPESISRLDSYSDVFLQEFPQEDYASLNFNSCFIEVLKTDDQAENITAITRSDPWSLYSYNDGKTYRSGTECIVIMSYEPTLGVFVVIELNPVYFTEMEIMDIAASLRIERNMVDRN